MNSFLNIQVRVIAAQARAQLAQLQRQIGALNFTSATAGASRFGNALGRMGLDRIGSRVQWLGRQIEYNFTLPILLAGGAAVKMALDNEKAFTRITKVYGDATHGAQFYHAEIDSLRKAFVALSNQFGISQEDTLNIAADWAAAGASGLALAKSVQLTMKTMVLGELDAATATKSLIAIQSQYGQSIAELSDTIDILNMVENQTGISMAGLIDGFTRSAGVARASGVSVRELAADLAALTPATGSAANAGNALKTIFSRLLSPTQDTSEVLGLMGINVRSLGFQSATAQQKLLMMASSFEKLSDAQKGLVSSIIASRYQVNRFEILMQELSSDHGFYQKALQSTEHMTDVWRQSQSELNMVLQSSPRRLQIMWTMIKNASADIIQPMIPLVLYLAQSLQKLVQGFSKLNPGLQKFILSGLVALAFIGPVVRYIGALQVLLFELARAATLVLVPFRMLFALFQLLVLIPVRQFFLFIPIAIRAMITATAALLSVMPALFTVMMTSIQRILIVGAKIAGDIWRMWLLASGRVTVFFGSFIAGIWRVIMFTLSTLTSAGWALIQRVWIAGLTAIQGALIAFAAFSGRVWRITMAAPLIVARAMFTSLIALFTRGLAVLRVVGLAMVDALTGPWGIAITIIVVLILTFWKQIKQIWNNIIAWFSNNGKAMANAFKPLGNAANAVARVVIRAFNALPEGIRNALLAVVRVVAAAAKAVAHWFSYLNPWARHSPSLVDNVTSGVEEIKRQYAKLTDVGSAFARAADDLELFGNAVKAVNRSAEANHYAEIRKDLVAMASDAVGPFDRLVGELYELEDQLKSVGAAMDAQQAIVDALKSQLDDANDSLSLQKDILDQMKDAVDDYQQKIDIINGSLEVLTGMRTELRNAGAGSDILGTYDQEIKALDNQKKGINDQLTAAQKAYNDQKKLVDDLTAARDKLQKSYDEENKKLDIIKDAYQKIQDRIQAITAAINDFASAVDQLKNAGKSDDLAKNFAAGEGANFADVGGSGFVGREGGIEDQAKLIDDFTKKLADETKNMFGLFSFLGPIKKAWNVAVDWLVKNVGPVFSLIGNFFSHMFDNVPNPFAKINFGKWISTLQDIGKTLLDWWGAVWRLIGPPLADLGKMFIDVFQRAVKEIGPELAKFKDLIEPVGQLFKELWTVLKPVAAIIGGVLLLAIIVLARVLIEVLKPTLNFVIDFISSLLKVLRGIIEFITGVFTGNWKLAWQGVVDIFGGIIGAIWSLLKNGVLVIWGIVKGLVEGIVEFFTWLYDELVGHSIIPDLVNAAISWFTFLKDTAVSIWNAFMAALKWIWENILSPIFEAMKTGFNLVVRTFQSGVDAVKFYWNLFKQYAQDAWNVVSNIINYIRDKFWDIVNGISNAVNTAHGWIDSFVNGILGIRSRISGAFNGIFDSLKSAFSSAMNWVIGKWNNLSFGVGPFKVDTPNIAFLAQGGFIANQAMAVVGEGRQGYPEFVIPTDPQYRKRALMLFEALGNKLGFNNLVGSAGVMRTLAQQLTRGVAGDKIKFFASGGILGRTSMRGTASGGAIVFAQTNNKTELHFHGDLSFPNIKDGGDAEEFLRNLEALAGS